MRLLINITAHKGPFTGEGHVGLYEILTTSWHAQLAINAYPQVLKLMCLSVSLNLFKNEQLFTEMVSNNSNITLRKNLVGRNNQQETKSYEKSLGSSETLRGTFFSHTNNSHTNNSHINSFKLKKNKKSVTSSVYNFEAFLNSSNNLKKTIPEKKQQFLEWFIGFSEGDGSFGLRDKNVFTFTINQAELKILHKIRTELGFGRLKTFKQEGSTYARYEVKKKEHIYKLIQLFNGNIHLQKVHKRFELWVNAYNKKYQLSGENFIVVKPRLKPTDINLETSWLSGFCDADGGFHASLSTNKKRDGKTTYLRLRLNAYLDQKDEYEIFEHIRKLFGISSVTVRNEARKLYRLDCNTKKTLEKALAYYEVHKVQSKKHIVYAMWKKVVCLFLENKHLNNLSKVERRVQRIKEQNALFKREKTVLANLPTEIFKEFGK